MSELARLFEHADRRRVPPVPVVSRRPWALVVAGTVVLCALPALGVGGRTDTWTHAALSSMSGAAGLAALVVGLLSLDTVLAVPSSVLATVAARPLGLASACAAIFAGLCLGNGPGYSLGRVGSPLVERIVGPDQLGLATARIGSPQGGIALAVTRPVPVLSEVAVVLAGLSRAPLAGTAAVCALANLGLAVAYAGLGSAASGPITPPLLLAGAAGVPLVAMASLAVYERFRPSDWTTT